MNKDKDYADIVLEQLNEARQELGDLKGEFNRLFELLLRHKDHHKGLHHLKLGGRGSCIDEITQSLPHKINKLYLEFINQKRG